MHEYINFQFSIYRLACQVSITHAGELLFTLLGANNGLRQRFPNFMLPHLPKKYSVI